MKKIILVLLLLVLAACGQKKDDKQTSEAKNPISASLPVLSKSESRDEPTSTKLLFPKGDSDSQQKQTIRYQGDKFLGLTMEQTSPLSAELQEAVNQVGAEETQKMLNESFFQDEKNAALRDLAGFSMTYEIVNNELKMTSSYDFQQLDVDKASSIPALQSAGLKELLKVKPLDYIDRQKQNGAVEVDN